VTEKHLAAVGASELLLYHTSLAAALKFVSPEISISPRKERLMRTLEAAEERLEIRDVSSLSFLIGTPFASFILLQSLEIGIQSKRPT